MVRVLVVTGAGVSAESGIPTFRGKDGYWRNLDPIKLATPEAFARDPELVWQWYRERRRRIRDAQPNAAHEAIAKLAQCADEFLLVTQNVDDLHERVAIFNNTIAGLGSPRRSAAQQASMRMDGTMVSRDVRNAVRSCGLAWFGSASLCQRLKRNVLRTICNAILAGL